MRAERRKLRKAIAVVALMGLAVAGCSGSDKEDEGATKSDAAAKSQKPDGPGNGQLLIFLDEAGHLASVDPKTGKSREIADLVVERGGLAVHSSGLALFQLRGKLDEDGNEQEPDGRLVIVDANGASATPTIALKSGGGQYGDGAGDPEDLPIVAALRESGGGMRFAMIPSSAGTLLVNLEKRSAVDLTATLGAPGKLGVTTRFSPDERWGIVTLPDTGLVLFSTDDPAKHTAIDGGSLGFSADGKLLFVDRAAENGPGKVWGVPVDGGSEVVFAEGDIRFRGAVGNSVVIAEPAVLYLSSKPGDRRPLDMPFNREEDGDTFVAPIGTGGRGLVFSGERDDRRFALVDESTAKVTPLPALDKFEVALVTDDRIVFAGAFNEEANVASAFALLGAATGTVTPVATWDPAGTRGAFPVPSPDGRSVALSYDREADQSYHVKIIKPGEGETDLDGSFAGWSPDGSAILLVRIIDEKPRMFVIDLATKKEKDLGPGFGGVWTAS